MRQRRSNGPQPATRGASEAGIPGLELLACRICFARGVLVDPGVERPADLAGRSDEAAPQRSAARRLERCGEHGSSIPSGMGAAWEESQYLDAGGDGSVSWLPEGDSKEDHFGTSAPRLRGWCSLRPIHFPGCTHELWIHKSCIAGAGCRRGGRNGPETPAFSRLIVLYLPFRTTRLCTNIILEPARG